MKKTTADTLETENLATKARRAIEDAILSGRLLPGDVLDERIWANRLGISRTPIREAIRDLTSQGLVKSPPRQQAFVCKVDGSELIELFEALIGLETLVAELAARRITDAELEKLRSVHEASEAAMKKGDIEAFQACNMRFHTQLADASRNETLLRYLRSVRTRVTPYRAWLFEKLDRMTQSFADHGNIIEALEKRDSVLVRQLMREHEKIDSDRLFDFLLSDRTTTRNAG